MTAALSLVGRDRGRGTSRAAIVRQRSQIRRFGPHRPNESPLGVVCLT
jgi:hypothetical protein